MSLPPPTSRALAWLAVAIVAALLIWLLAPILMPFLAAAILAYICDPLVDRLQRRRVPRTLGALLMLFLVMGVFAALTLILIPLLHHQATALAERVPDYVDTLRTRVAPWLKTFGVDIDLDLEGLRTALQEHMAEARNVAARLLPSLKTGGLAVIGFVTNLALVPVILFYMLRDWNDIVRRIGETIPRRWHGRAVSLAEDIDDVLGQFLRGQILVMLIMSAYYVAGLWFIGLDSALAIGVLTGLLVFIPYLGAIMGFVLGTLAGLIQYQLLGELIPVWVVFAIGQLLEGFVVTPWLQGDRVGLHPVLVIFALMAFGQLFGFVGLLLAIPATAALFVWLRRVRTAYLASDIYRN